LDAIPDVAQLPAAPCGLHFGEVTLELGEIVPGDEARAFVPYYHFRILLSDGTDVGHINFRVGDTRHVQLAAGHIGFEIEEPRRGNRYALQACRAIAPLVRMVYSSVIVTCDPENVASRRTIEKLGATFIDEIAVPLDDPICAKGPRTKRRYRWMPAATAST
jgi:tagatose 1,6-diphosphate aldolase